MPFEEQGFAQERGLVSWGQALTRNGGVAGVPIGLGVLCLDGGTQLGVVDCVPPQVGGDVGSLAGPVKEEVNVQGFGGAFHGVGAACSQEGATDVVRVGHRRAHKVGNDVAGLMIIEDGDVELLSVFVEVGNGGMVQQHGGVVLWQWHILG